MLAYARTTAQCLTGGQSRRSHSRYCKDQLKLTDWPRVVGSQGSGNTVRKLSGSSSRSGARYARYRETKLTTNMQRPHPGLPNLCRSTTFALRRLAQTTRKIDADSTQTRYSGLANVLPLLLCLHTATPEGAETLQPRKQHLTRKAI